MRKAPSTVQDLGTTPAINWRPLNRFSKERPTLLWTSIPDSLESTELDRIKLPGLRPLGARYVANKGRKPPDSLLACKAFWEEFQRSQLVIIFDRYAGDPLLHRIYESLDAKAASVVETLLVFGGTMKFDDRLVLSIKKRLNRPGRTSEFHFVNRMQSNLPPFPHDRFAVTNGEFWHFGGSVGGEFGLTGVSRGWSAKDVGVEDFVTETWSALENGKSDE